VLARKGSRVTGREVAQLAFELKKPPRVRVTLIGGGAWAVHRAGKTFAGIKEDPVQITKGFIQSYGRVRLRQGRTAEKHSGADVSQRKTVIAGPASALLSLS